MNIAGIQRSSTVDYPGLLSCVLFTRGCNMNCFYCHNRALIGGTAALLDGGEVLAFLKKRAGLLDGAVISGGEPTLQSDLFEYCAMLRSLGYKIKLDTNGSDPRAVKRLIDSGLLDYLAVDIKAAREEYPSVAGADGFEGALETLALAQEAGVACEGRTTVYPGLGEEGLAAIAKSLPLLPRWRLNHFNMPEQYREADLFRLRRGALTHAGVEALLPALSQIQPNVTI